MHLQISMQTSVVLIRDQGLKMSTSATRWPILALSVRIVLLVFVFLIETNLFAATSCSGFFDVGATSTTDSGVAILSKIENIPPALDKILRAGLLRRYWNSPEVISLAESLNKLKVTPQNLSLGQGSDVFASLVSKSHEAEEMKTLGLMFQMDGSDGSLVKGLNSRTVNYTIGVFRSFDGNPGSRPTGLNMKFGEFMVAALRAIDMDLAQNPNLDTVEIGANSVVNEGVYKLLVSWGFTKHNALPVADNPFEHRVSPMTQDRQMQLDTSDWGDGIFGNWLISFKVKR